MKHKRVKVKFFGLTSDAAGTNECTIEFAEFMTVIKVCETMKAQYPALAGLRLLIAVNEEYSGPDAVLKDGDEVAIFTAVSGG